MVRHKNKLEKSKYYQRVRQKNKSIPDPLLKLLIKQKYHIAGEHSAAKLCHWSASSLCGGEKCYKQKFYGIESHRCLQCTPVLLFCNHACLFCWRIMPEKKLQQLPEKNFKWDSPQEIAEGLIAAQREIISGFGGNKKVPAALYKEALLPKHAAISLTGEPTFYPYIEKLIEEFHRRNMTTFLVTNGTFPERIESLKTYPTQLYVSMVAPNEEIYKKAIRPVSPSLWKKYLKTLSLFPSLEKKTRTVLRMTLTRGINDFDLEGYAKQIKFAQPHYVEVKSMVYVGGARSESRCLGQNSMLSHNEIKEIAERLSNSTGYITSEEHFLSRVVLLCKDKEKEEKRLIL